MVSGIKKWKTDDIDFAVFINVYKEKGFGGREIDERNRLWVVFNNFDEVDQQTLEHWKQEYENSKCWIADQKRKELVQEMAHIRNRKKLTGRMEIISNKV